MFFLVGLVLLLLFSFGFDVGLASAEPQLAHLGATPHPPWERWRLDRAAGPRLDVYTTRVKERRPVVLMIQGSKCYPLFSYREKQGQREIVSPLIFTEVTNPSLPPVVFAAVERRGIESFGARPTSRPTCTETFGAVTKPDRVRDVADAVLAIRAQPWAGPVYLVGHSEGGDVASGVAKLLGDRVIAGVALLAGSGPTQFFDFAMEARHTKDLARLKRVFDDVLYLTGPEAEGKLNGMPIARWKSFAIDSSPLDDLRGLRTPVFVAQGSLDAKASVEGADLIVLELLREPARAISYLLLPECDHDFACDGGTVDRTIEVMRRFLAFVDHPTRGVQIGLDPPTL